MPGKLTRDLNGGKRPKSSSRREMIRIIIDDVVATNTKPGKKNLAIIARNIVSAYPDSFEDKIDGDVVGTGYDSLVKQLVSRVENVSRGTLTSPRQLPLFQDEPDDNIQKVKLDTYGCINYAPDLPEPEEMENQVRKKNEMKTEFSKTNYSTSLNIDELVKGTYALQRNDILGGCSLAEMKSDWPYLFSASGMNSHFKELTGIDAKRCLENFYTTKGQKILNYMNIYGNRTIKSSIERVSAEVGNDSPQQQGIILFIIKELGEEEKTFFKVMEVCWYLHIVLKFLDKCVDY